MSEPGFALLGDYFADFLVERSGLSGAPRQRFRELVVELCLSLDEGHSCLPVGDKDRRLLASLPLVSDGTVPTPLVLGHGRLYLYRYFHYEHRLACQLGALAAEAPSGGTRKELLAGDADPPGAEIDWQRRAARLALEKMVTIICGGPGTGKTTTVVKILALLIQAAERPPEVALAAPTGKAAMRLSEAVGKSLGRQGLPKGVAAAIPTQAMTLHRLLGVRRFSPQFRHNRQRPLPFDVVVVDEASMVDLALMSKLVDALKPGARLVLLGDKDQLASVESGAVLADLVAGLPENTIELQKSYRFNSSIQALAGSIKRGDADTAWQLLVDPKVPQVALAASGDLETLGENYVEFMQAAHRQASPDVQTCFDLFRRFQVLSALHYGSGGVAGINRRVETFLARRGFPCRPSGWYPGRPVLITRNDYGLDLFNGDIGICLPGGADGGLQVWFERPDGGFRRYSPLRLPPCETVFAMTIHKSQGSEFDRVVVVLPEEDNRLLSRELIYTAVTRARTSVMLVAGRQLFAEAVSRGVARFSGLGELLCEKVPPASWPHPRGGESFTG